MKPLTKEWVDKAEGDFVMANRELRARKSPNYDGVCFHPQQCAEKYFKARLQEANTAFARTHDLVLLLTMCVAVEPLWAVLENSADVLKEFAVRWRYPGATADKAQAKLAMKSCTEIRAFVRQSLGLKV
jgi:HEPN domain-containing protein